ALGVRQELGRVEPAVGGDRGDERRAPALGGGAEDAPPDAGPVPQRDGEVAQAVAVDAVDPLDDHAVHGPAGQLLGLVAGQLPLEGLHLVAQRLDLLEALAGTVDHLPDGHVEDRGQLPQDGLLLPQALDRAGAGDRLDAAQVRADRTLGHDLDRADVAEGPDVGAAAQLDRVAAGLEDPDHVAVLV